MRQFNLKEYLKNPNVKLQTRTGQSVRIICTDAKSITNYPVVGLVRKGENEERITRYNINGFAYTEDLDLFFTPVKHVGYLAVNYFEGDRFVSTVMYPSKEKAIAETKCDEVIEVNWEY